MEQESLGPRSELDQYEDLIQWLDMAYEMLQVIELPVYHHEAEFSVCLLELSWLIYYVKSVLP